MTSASASQSLHGKGMENSQWSTQASESTGFSYWLTWWFHNHQLPRAFAVALAWDHIEHATFFLHNCLPEVRGTHCDKTTKEEELNASESDGNVVESSHGSDVAKNSCVGKHDSLRRFPLFPNRAIFCEFHAVISSL
mmetsp:Transcript_16258/g.28398  ORF Transcript_16258/g.28398 Transcript_16258/m.28398 type:complete len:137 (-) Transcript_16258:914-1324(-)